MTDRDALDALRPAWSDLLAASDCDVPFLSPDWLLTWWDTFGPHEGRQLRVLTFHHFTTGQLIGLAPFLLRRHRYFGALPFRRLEPLGSGEREADSICTDYLNVLAHRDHASAVVRALTEALTRGPLRDWDELILPNMDGTGARPEQLAGALRCAGLRAELTTTTHAPYLPLPGSWEALLKGLEKKERYLVNRTLRDLEDWSAGDYQVLRATDPLSLAAGWQALRQLHADRWDGTSGGTFRSPLFLAFHERLSSQLLRRGEVDLSWLVVRGEPAAAMYSFTHRGRTYFYQCGRKRDVPPQVRPGGALLYLAIRHAIEAGQVEFDFLGGEATYKRQLTRSLRPLVRLRAVRPSAREAARVTLERAKDWARPVWRWLRRRGSGSAPSRAQPQTGSEKG